jgi:hypothetical protein
MKFYRSLFTILLICTAWLPAYAQSNLADRVVSDIGQRLSTEIIQRIISEEQAKDHQTEAERLRTWWEDACQSTTECHIGESR